MPQNPKDRGSDDGADEADDPANAVDDTILPDNFVHLVARYVAAHIAREEEDEHGQHRRQAKGDGCAGAKLERAHGLLIGQDRIDFGQVARATVGQEPDGLKAVEGPNGRKQRGNGDDIAQPRKRDVQETLPGIGPVNFGCFIQLCVDGREARQYVDGEEGNTRPHIDGNHRGHRRGWFREPSNWLSMMPSAMQDRVKTTKERVIDRFPGERLHDRGNDPRQQDQTCQQVLEPFLAVQQQGRDHAEDELEGNRPNRKDECRLDGLAIERILKEANVIVEADKYILPLLQIVIVMLVYSALRNGQAMKATIKNTIGAMNTNAIFQSRPKTRCIAGR